MVNTEITTFTFTSTKGTPTPLTPIPNVGGAVLGISVEKVFRVDDQTTYDIIVTHDDAGSVAVDFFNEQVTVTEGTDLSDVALSIATTGAILFTSVKFLERSGTSRIYDITVVALNA